MDISGTGSLNNHHLCNQRRAGVEVPFDVVTFEFPCHNLEEGTCEELCKYVLGIS